MFFSKKLLLSEIMVTVIIFLWLSYSFISLSLQILPDKMFPVPKTSIMFKLRKCLINAFEGRLSPEDYIIHYRKCLNAFVPNNIKLDKFYMGRLGENKIFLPLKKSFNQSECKWLTIGIGGTSNAERIFKQKYPNSSIFGIEPSPDQYANFMDFGTVIPFAVGAVNGSFNITIREQKQYKIQQMPVIALSDLLDKFLQTRIIHFMTIDIEGFEFNILQELLHHRILHQQRIVFCQIDAELHGKNKTLTAELLHSFNTDDSDYLPIFTAKFLIHEKVTWINFKEEKCKDAFDIEQFLI